MRAEIEDVQSFWNSNPCQSDLSAAEDKRAYFEEISRKRYGHREWHVPEVAKFGSFAGKDVLEIGCGIATDGLEFAKRGARYVGVDLTPNAVELAKERFGLFGVPGKFFVANAEVHLPFSDESFDHIYSFGVIHHSPKPENIVKELHRVLRKGGTFTVMLYNRTSINYYVEIMFLRRVFRWLLLPSFMPGLLSRLAGFDRWKLEGHRKTLIEKKAASKEEWVSMNTDGPYCPLAKVYSHAEAAELFKHFSNVTQEIWEFNEDHWPIIRSVVPTTTLRGIGRRWGWHRMIYGKKA